MKSLKMNGLQRLLSFVLIAVLLICIVGFAAGGWQSNPDNEPDSGNVGDKTDKTDENTDGDNSNDTEQNTPPANDTPDDTETPPVPEPPKYYSTVTGLEITEEQSTAIPLGFVIDPSATLYGNSYADITFEFPIENGNTRMLSYISNVAALWKIGSLAPTRAFISGTSNFFGGVVISYGNDDIIKYSAWDASKIEIDISAVSACYYVENTLYIYTSKDMVNLALNNSVLSSNNGYKNAPYNFAELETNITGTADAKTVIIPYSKSNETEFYYSEISEQYLYFKTGTRKVDMLNGKNLSFTNVFILFANATTYEKATGTELIMDTSTGGAGYYISRGTVTEIHWSLNGSGDLEFNTLSGEKLTVNRGNSYIGYFKASNASDVVFA